MFGRKNRGIDSFDSETAGRKRGRWLNLGSAAVLVTVFYYLIGMVSIIKNDANSCRINPTSMAAALPIWPQR
jgi:hypothetical protein